MKFKVFFNLLLIITMSVFLFSCMDIPSAYIVSGTVRDSFTGEGIPFASVQVGDRATYTDSTGYYLIEFDSGDPIT
ncbi:MAG: hypothetical protein JW969_15520, partial [Spirochaetales bacterium]|nr:hypothetical protein [Spirochaetales bacterium]